MIGSLATSLLFTVLYKRQNVNEAPVPLLPSNRTDQRLQHQPQNGIGPLDWLMRRAYTKSLRKLTTQRDVNTKRATSYLGS